MKFKLKLKFIEGKNYRILPESVNFFQVTPNFFQVGRSGFLIPTEKAFDQTSIHLVQLANQFLENYWEDQKPYPQ